MTAPPGTTAGWRGPPPAGRPGTTGRRRAAEPTPTGPLGFLDVLDGSFQLYRASGRQIVAVTLATLVPVQLLAAFLQRDSLLTGGLGSILNDPALAESILASGDADVLGTAVSLVLVQGLVLPVLTGCWIALAVDAYHGRPADLRAALRTTRRHAPALVAAWWLHTLCYAVVVAPAALVVVAGVGGIGGGIVAVPLAIFGPLALLPLLVLIAPAIVVEGLGPVAALQRSARLARRRYGALIGLVLGTSFVFGLVTVLLSGIPEVVAFLSGLGFAWVLLAMAATVSELISGPLTANATTLMFLDARIRVEGHDLIEQARRLRGDNAAQPAGPRP